MRGDLEDRLISVLFKYKITPHTTTGETPSLLLMGRIPRNRLSAIMANVKQHVTDEQQRQVIDHNKSAKERSFFDGDTVYAMNCAGKPRCYTRTIMACFIHCTFEGWKDLEET